MINYKQLYSKGSLAGMAQLDTIMASCYDMYINDTILRVSLNFAND